MRTDYDTIDAMLANSYRDFHAKGVDYICLHRTPTETLKLYTFADATASSDVVYPHDHRYAFSTEVLAGELVNLTYCSVTRDIAEMYKAKPFSRFEWRTPLNGGAGFSYAEEAWLVEHAMVKYWRGDGDSMSRCYSTESAIHTIRVRPSTVLLLRQYEDRVPLDVPTSTYAVGDAPKISGLYRRWAADDLLSTLRAIEMLDGAEILRKMRGSE